MEGRQVGDWDKISVNRDAIIRSLYPICDHLMKLFQQIDEQSNRELGNLFQKIMGSSSNKSNRNHRDKDISARKYLRSCIEGKGITSQTLFEQVSSFEFQPS
jgi:hypothetical protein